MRSPFAEAALKARARTFGEAALRVQSAGTDAVRGRSAELRMHRAALSLDLSLEQHTAKPLTPDLVNNADLILVMDHLNESTVLASFPGLANKVRLLGSYARSPRDGAEIPDPFLGDDSMALECAQRINIAVDELCRSFRSPEQRLAPSISFVDSAED